MRLLALAVSAACLQLGGCIYVNEAALPNNQRIAFVTHPGDGISPPVTVALMQDRKGNYVPISTGYAAAPVTSVLTGAATAGVAVGAGAAIGAAQTRRTTNFTTAKVCSNVSNAAVGNGGAATAC